VTVNGCRFYFSFLSAHMVPKVGANESRRDGRHSHLEINFPNLDGVVAAEVLTLEVCFGHVGLMLIQIKFDLIQIKFELYSVLLLIRIKQERRWDDLNLY